eukprot:TRINITY_DN5312_c0_g4_i1.p1 TRINITY_DN5312_c0_g4~~TRINITY_DN5312_c0_g4_i1.p1  ORF type:complete len:119 (-),score=8.55 TRINITY_DN5312_c0_g4_i1:341-697(-)
MDLSVWLCLILFTRATPSLLPSLSHPVAYFLGIRTVNSFSRLVRRQQKTLEEEKRGKKKNADPHPFRELGTRLTCNHNLFKNNWWGRIQKTFAHKHYSRVSMPREGLGYKCNTSDFFF